MEGRYYSLAFSLYSVKTGMNNQPAYHYGFGNIEFQVLWCINFGLGYVIITNGA